MADSRFVTMNNGVQHPLIGFGTYKIGFVPASSNTAGVAGHAPDQDPKDIIKAAITTGYRYIDCAQFYGNEKMVGQALAECGVPRAELFLVSKVWGDKIYEGGAAIRQQLETTLADLGTDYLDSYLVHWPVPGNHVAAYQTLEALLDEGKVRSIGVSNYTIEDYQALAAVMRIKPVINQIEINPFLYRRNTIEFFQKEGVVLQSYRALRQGKAMDHPLIVAIAAKHARTPAQVLGRWCVQKGIVVVAKSARLERMRENMGIFDFALSPEDEAALDALTTPDSLQEFKQLYDKCIIRDTPLGPDVVPSAYTID
uniref:NADP-dependent oxidoreductase domain-containing protein n=1 Tax=Cryptomonas curvata TaxID=233186 RepID=A0A7S0M9P1_9CRYP